MQQRGFLLKKDTKPIQAARMTELQIQGTASGTNAHTRAAATHHNEGHPLQFPSTARDRTCRSILDSDGKKVSRKDNVLLKTFSCQDLLVQM